MKTKFYSCDQLGISAVLLGTSHIEQSSIIPKDEIEYLKKKEGVE